MRILNYSLFIYLKITANPRKEILKKSNFVDIKYSISKLLTIHVVKKIKLKSHKELRIDIDVTRILSAENFLNHKCLKKKNELQRVRHLTKLLESLLMYKSVNQTVYNIFHI